MKKIGNIFFKYLTIQIQPIRLLISSVKMVFGCIENNESFLYSIESIKTIKNMVIYMF